MKSFLIAGHIFPIATSAVVYPYEAARSSQRVDRSQLLLVFAQVVRRT